MKRLTPAQLIFLLDDGAQLLFDEYAKLLNTTMPVDTK